VLAGVLGAWYDLSMAWSLTKKIISNRPYWYARICRRVDGKPRIVQTRYLGTADDLVAARDTQRQPLPPREVTLAEFGASAALWDIAQKLRLVETVDRHAPKRDQGVSVGQYVTLAALNRAVAPCSKAAFADWYGRSVASRLIPARASQLSSQRFWDHFSPITEAQLGAIERDLCRTAIEEFHLDLRLLLFDPTNVFTFIDTFNAASTLAQRGKSKEGRESLRILGLAVVATADGPVPLLHDLYPGNHHDTTEFPVIVERLTERLGEFRDRVEDITLVFDKGNNSQDNFDQLVDTPLNFVGSLVPTHYPELLQIPLDQFEPLTHSRLQDVLALRCAVHVFGHWRTVVVTHNPRLFEAQRKTLEREVRKRLRKLRALKRRLDRWRSGRGRGKAPTVESVQKNLTAILHGRHMKQLIEAVVAPTAQGPSLVYGWNHRAWRELSGTLLGKTIVFTDHDDWSDEEIILAYRGQYLLEELHKRIKDPHVLSFRPTRHWTDGMLRVHALYCFVALLLASLLRRQLAQQGLDLPLGRLLRELRDIREVALLYPTRRGRPHKPVTCLSHMTALQEDLFARLDLARHAANPS